MPQSSQTTAPTGARWTGPGDREHEEGLARLGYDNFGTAVLDVLHRLDAVLAARRCPTCGHPS